MDLGWILDGILTESESTKKCDIRHHSHNRLQNKNRPRKLTPSTLDGGVFKMQICRLHFYLPMR